MSAPAYTLARWYVKQGREADFISAWSGELADYFMSLPGSRWGTLLQSTEDPRHFYSFGPMGHAGGHPEHEIGPKDSGSVWRLG